MYNLYFSVAVRSFRRATTYRMSYLAGIITNAAFGALLCFVYQALYAGQEVVAGLSLNDAISYVWATQSLISVGAAWIVNTEIAQSIRSGDVVTDLSRPWNYYLYWFSRVFGDLVYNLLLRGSLTYLIGVLYFNARIPSLFDLLAFIPIIVLAMVIAFAFSFIVNLSTFWLIENSGVIMFASVLQMFFSGFILPLAYFPPALATIALFLPFHLIASVPARTILGQIPLDQIGGYLLLQIFWAIMLIGLGLWLQNLAMRKVVVQGG